MEHINTEDVVFTWALENFSMCPLKMKQSMQSPYFYMRTPLKTKWSLLLFPKGDTDSFIGCSLCREDDEGPEVIIVNCRFSFVIADGVSEFELKSKTDEYEKCTDIYHTLIEVTELYKKNKVLLPRDTLTIRCRLSDANSETEDGDGDVKALVDCLYEDEDSSGYKVPEEVQAMSRRQVADIKRKLFPYINEYSARDWFKVEKRHFTWPIQNISSFKTGKKESVQLQCNSERAPPFTLSFSFKGSNENGQIDILKLSKKVTKPFYVICHLAVLDINGREHLSTENGRHFESLNREEVWSMPTFFTKEKLIEHKRLCLPNDTLYLLCTFKISVYVAKSEMEEYKFTSLVSETYTDVNPKGMMVEDFTSFYNSKKHFDVELEVEGKTLQAHKAVLCSRSAEFSTMFDQETAENISNTLHIPDVDAKTLEQMLYFMYTDSVQNLECESAIKLYSAAERYQVISLKKKCSSFIKSILNKVNVYNILILADLHQDKELRQAAQKFLYEPPYEAFLSSEFEKLIDCNSSLARSTLRGWINKWKLDCIKKI